MSPVRNQTVVGANDCLMEIGMLHIASVDEEVLMATFLLCRLGLTHKTRDATERRINLDRQDVLIETLAKHIGDALPQRSRLEVEHLGTIIRMLFSAL